MNVDTPLFRGTLSLVAIWLALWAYLTFQSYQSEYREPHEINFSGGPEITAECYSQKLDFRGTNPVWREPTTEEKADCLDRSFDAQLKRTLESNEALVWQSLKKCLKVGLIPAISLLALIAFWSSLARVCVSIARRYANWLRHGTKGNTDIDGRG